MNVAITILLIADAVVTLWLLFVTFPAARRRAYNDGLECGITIGMHRQRFADSSNAGMILGRSANPDRNPGVAQ